MNVGDEYLGRDKRIGAWRDTHLRMLGPATLCLQLSFVEDWHWATDEVPELEWTPVPVETNIPVLVLPSGPADHFETANLMVQHFVDAAHRRLWISSPYFVPDEGVISALKLAALRGVDVRILIPERPDNLLTYYPGNLSWTCSSVRLARRLARRDDAAWSLPARRSNAARRRARRAIGRVADSPIG